jgi:CheY-like chemotaxis protein
MQLDEIFLKQVRDVLAHLYDYPYLQTHPLIGHFRTPDGLDARGRMRFLRSLILEAVEGMSPGPRVPFRSRRARAYDVLNLHYVEGLMVQEVARELAISERQVYRDLRRAERHLTALLRLRRRPAEESGRDRVPTEVVRAEAERLREDGDEVEIAPLLQRALGSVARLAKQRRVSLAVAAPTVPVTVRTHRMISQQALVSVLSHAIQHAAPDRDVTLSIAARRGGVEVRVSYVASADVPGGWRASLTTPQQLVELQGGKWEAIEGPDGQRLISFTLGADSRSTVLVIDDNEGLIELLRRYLTDQSYRLIGAGDGALGLRMAEEHSPDAIVLDVMMPQQDGWEVLQLLSNRQRTRDIPVLVCSVIEDPELAFSLGAAAFLSKPVRRDDLLRALELCGR